MLVMAFVLSLFTGAADPTGDKIVWRFSANGSSVNQKKTGYRFGKDGSLTIWSEGGKLQPKTPDEVAFVYTAIPSDRNFVLNAEMTVDSWSYGNGQEGFGLLAEDRVAPHRDATAFWNNTYRLGVQKVEYPQPGSVGWISMKQGIGACEKTGVTPERLERLKALDTEAINTLNCGITTLERSCESRGAGTYNLIGHRKNPTQTDVADPIVTLRLRLEKNNTGYFLSYIDGDGNLATQKYYDPAALEQLDPDYVYVGMFCTRSAAVTFRDISLVTSDRLTDPPAEDKPERSDVPEARILSEAWANAPEYTLRLWANCDGWVSVSDPSGKTVLSAAAVRADQLFRSTLPLHIGDNSFELRYTPAGDPSSASGGVLTLPLQVELRRLGEETIYVSPRGEEQNDGTAGHPVDIATAVRFAAPGQTIELQGGTYALRDTLIVGPGICGTADAPITMRASGGERPVLDFVGVGGGLLLLGDHWNLSGFDVTRSADYTPGIQLCGSHCRLDDIFTYENGNTGVLICALNRETRHPGNEVFYVPGVEKWEPWPHDELVTRCVSYGNADQGWEDADGFAAKVCCGGGIVFEDCLAYNNSDDGWDLFAKPEYGPVGPVTIRRCAAFANGYGYDRSVRGNGNGFKLGGGQLSGHHRLTDSVAFDNRALGITANTCPDVEILRCIALDNGGKNLILSSKNTSNTDYLVEGLLSFRSRPGADDVVSGKGTQRSDKLWQTGNFYWQKGRAVNSSGAGASGIWFRSLQIPAADPGDPRAVGESLRRMDGSMDLGDFLALSDEGSQALHRLGVSFEDHA